MDSQQDPSRNAKTILPWKLIHPKSLHDEDQPHVTLGSLIKYHWSRKEIHSIKRVLQCFDFVLVNFTTTFFFVMPMLIKRTLGFKNEITIREFYCLILSGYYKRNHIKNEDTNSRL